MTTKQCAQCGKFYGPRPQAYDRGHEWAKYADSSFCSLECFHEARRQAAAERRSLAYKICEQCGKRYGRIGRQATQFARSKYCSQECFGLAQRNRISDITDKIRIDAQTDCHLWIGSKYGKGYGQTRIDGRMMPVHRLMWQYYHGPIPDGLEIDHLCGNKACCNVKHLRLVTAQENTLASNNMAARYARREVCDKCGGEYSTFPNGIRYCKPCRHAKMMEYQRWRRAEKKAGRSGVKG